MRIPREVWWIAALTAASALLVVLLGGPKDPEEDQQVWPNRTTYSSSPTGLRGLYLTLGELGYDVSRLRRPLTRADLPKKGVLFVVEPLKPGLLSHHEERDLVRWVEAGNSLVFCSETSSLVLVGSAAEPAEEGLMALFDEPESSDARPVQPVSLMTGIQHLAIRSPSRLSVGPGGEAAGEMPEENAWYEDAGTSVLRERLHEAVPIAGDSQGAVAAYARLGRGHAVLFTSPWSLSNDGIDEADNLTFVLNLLGPPGSTPVYFDEYHHGYSDNVAWVLIPLPAKLALAQVLLGLLLVAYARSRRLGPVVPLVRGGRQRSEFLGTMTTVLSRGHATRLALRTAYEAAREQLRTVLGASPDADDDVLAETVERASPEGGARLRDVLAAVRAALDAPSSPTETRSMELIRQLDEAAAATRRIQ